MTVIFHDRAVEAAVTAALGKNGPHSAAQCSTISELSIAAAGDLQDLQYCSGLRSLSIHASAVQDLGPVAMLSRLHTLRLSCSTLTGIEQLRGHQALRELDVLFCPVSDLRPLLSLPGLFRGQFAGLPLDDFSMHELPQQIESVAGPLDIYPCFSWPWKSDRTFQLWLRQQELDYCFGMFLGRSLLVKPGPPLDKGCECNVLSVGKGSIETCVKVTHVHDALWALLQTEKYRGHILKSFTDEIKFEVGCSDVAHQWLKISHLPGELHAAVERLLLRFPQIKWSRSVPSGFEDYTNRVRQEYNVTLPDWYLLLLGRAPDFGYGFQTGARIARFDHNAWAMRPEQKLFYTFSAYGAYNNEEFKSVVTKDRFYMIAASVADTEIDEFYLAMNLGAEDDEGIYAIRGDQLGIDGLLSPPRLVFYSYASMLDSIDAISINVGHRVVEQIKD